MTLLHLGNGRLRVETPGELSAILKWLADADLEDVYIQPVGLRSVYDRFHFEDEESGAPAVMA
jgi:ABC-2 type transport system ATP-binding protein